MKTKAAGCTMSFLLPILLAAALSAPPAWGSPQRKDLEIKVLRQATVRGDSVSLGQIASFHPSGDPRVPELRGLEVASAPAPGNTLRFNRRFLNYKVGSMVAAYGDGVSLETPAALVVKRTAQVVPAERIEALFKEHILDSAPWDGEEMTIELLSTPQDIALPEGSLHWDIRENGNGDYLGNISATMTFYVDGSRVRRIPLSGRISVSGEVVRAVRPIRRGDLVQPEDVSLVRVNSTSRRHQALRDMDRAVGMRALRSIRPGQTLTARMVEDPPVIRKGSPVTIVAENEILRISTLGEALEDGRSGERIRVRNLRSGKEILSTVQGPERVSVTF